MSRARKAYRSPGELRADSAAWRRMTDAAATAAQAPGDEALRLALGKTVARCWNAAPPTPYTRGSVWNELMDTVRQFIAGDVFERTQLGEPLRLAAEGCAPLFEPAPPPPPRADIDG